MTRTSELSIFYFLIAIVSAWRPCTELTPSLRVPCRCKLEPLANGQMGAVAIDCDRVVFYGDSLTLPAGAPIVAFSQKFSGQQALPTQTFATSNLPIRKLDFSNNAIRRLPDKAFTGIQETLTELRLSNNLLGDSLNPIFSTIEFQVLENLRLLDISGNRIKAIEEGILKGCHKLQEIYIDHNSLNAVPSQSLNGPTVLKTISLRHNNILTVKSDAFAAQSNLERIDLRYNRINTVEGRAFGNLNQIKEIYLAGNRLSRMNSDVFNGAATLQKLDLSENFITNFPVIPLSEVQNVRVLNLSLNLITKLDASDLQNIRGIQILDLSRNGIATVPPGTFRDLKALKYLDLSLNSLRTIEDDALEGLDALQTLIIRDNNILLIPGSALGRLPRLVNLYLDFNRVAALSSEILGSIQPEEIRYMSLSRNVIRELPPASFQSFRKLLYLDLSGNSLAVLNAEMFMGLENSLLELRISQNKIQNVGTNPLALGLLRKLDLSENNIVEIPRNAFTKVDNLVHLNLSGNPHLAPVPMKLLHSLNKLQVIDMSNDGLKTLPIETFVMNPDLRVINLRNNGIQEIADGTFSNLRNLSKVDLSYNNILTIKNAAFVNAMNIRFLYLKGNKLSAFKGEFFNTGTGLEELDISDNQLSYLFPSSFRIHPRLKRLAASNNKFSFFPAELIASLQFLEHVDLAQNQLKSVEELDFARLPRLRELMLGGNMLESLSEMAFHNSTQLQVLDLSNNKLDRLGERTFEGLARIETLNLEGNNLTDLPDTIFERNKVQMLENIILSNNKFVVAPLKPLQRQFFFVSFVDLSRNMLKDIPADDSMMVNIKKLDLSYNPLSEDAIRNILSEPKTVRELNLAGTGIREIVAMETPFLQSLNLSHNQISRISDKVFERATLLENLDLSSNQLADLKPLSMIWPRLASLQHLDLSNNSFEVLTNGDFDNLEMLKSLSVHDLEKCSRIEKSAFKYLPNLSKLTAYNYPRLGYLDVQGILQELPGLESLDIEVKDAAVGGDQLQSGSHPRLKDLGIRGYRLRSISSGSFAGLKNRDLHIRLRNTSLTTIPPALLFPIPRSSNLDLDISGSMITVLPPQLLTALEDRRKSLTIRGLETNPLHCDCTARALRRWSPAHTSKLRCVSPDYLHGKLLTEVGDDELTCDPRIVSTTTTVAPSKSSSRIITRSTTAEPEIIWSMAPPTQSQTKLKPKPPLMKQPQMTNDDTLIIGIVGGVVAFIAILIIIICIARLKMNTPAPYRGQMVGMPPMAMGPGSVQMSYKNGPQPAIYAVPPYAHSYATLPHKVSQSSQQSGNRAYSTMGRGPYFQQQMNGAGQQQQPYIIYQDDKAYR